MILKGPVLIKLSSLFFCISGFRHLTFNKFSLLSRALKFFIQYPAFNVNPDEVAHLLHLFVGILLLGIPFKAFLDFGWGVVNWRIVFWRGNLGSMCHCLNQLGLKRCIITFPRPASSVVRLVPQNK